MTQSCFRLWATGCSHVGTDLRVEGRESLAVGVHCRSATPSKSSESATSAAIAGSVAADRHTRAQRSAVSIFPSSRAYPGSMYFAKPHAETLRERSRRVCELAGRSDSGGTEGSGNIRSTTTWGADALRLRGA